MNHITEGNLPGSLTLGQVVTLRPKASRVFHRHGLDYCCGGDRTVSAACEERGLDVLDLLHEIDGEETEPERSWAEQPLSALVEHIVERYHEPLREELPRLVALAGKVERRHSEKPTCPVGLKDHLETVLAEVTSHLAKEENILFPAIQAGRLPIAKMPIAVMVQEHKDHAANLQRTRELTGDLVPPEEACGSWRDLYASLEILERELMEHVHLENHILFPRALEG